MDWWRQFTKRIGKGNLPKELAKAMYQKNWSKQFTKPMGKGNWPKELVKAIYQKNWWMLFTKRPSAQDLGRQFLNILQILRIFLQILWIFVTVSMDLRKGPQDFFTVSLDFHKENTVTVTSNLPLYAMLVVPLIRQHIRECWHVNSTLPTWTAMAVAHRLHET